MSGQRGCWKGLGDGSGEGGKMAMERGSSKRPGCLRAWLVKKVK